MVINDYEKAKSLFGKTEVQVFKKCELCLWLRELPLPSRRRSEGRVLKGRSHVFRFLFTGRAF